VRERPVKRRRKGRLDPELQAKVDALIRAQDADADIAQLEREALATLGKLTPDMPNVLKRAGVGKRAGKSSGIEQSCTCPPDVVAHSFAGAHRIGCPAFGSDVRPAKPQRGGPSKAERAYDRHLAGLYQSGEVRNFDPQPGPLDLAHGCTYTGDWEVEYADGRVEWHEVKGAKVRRSKVTGKRGKARPWFADDGARVKVKVAARLLAARGVPLVVVFQDPRTKAWLRDVVKP
jgi:hypothetical protein